MDVIKNKVEESVKLVDKFREYYDYFEIGFSKLKPNIVNHLKHMIFDRYPDQRKKLLNRIQAINIEAFSELSPKEQQKLIFQTYYLLKQMDIVIYNIYKIFNEYSFEKSAFVDSELSSSIIFNSRNKEQNIKKYYDHFIETYHKITEMDIIEKFSNLIMYSIEKPSQGANAIDNIINLVININELFQKYPDTIHLFSHIMQELLNTYTSKEYKKLIQTITKLIEDDKAFILQSSISLSNKKNGSQNPFLRGFGLIPSEEFTTIEKLFSGINKSTNSSNKNNIFQQIAKKENVNILVLQNITTNPISHELWKLLNSDISNSGQDESKFSGITENLIEKTTTIKLLDPDKKWELSSYKIFEAKSDDFYILETLNNKSYRFLRYWIPKNPEKQITPIHRSKINGLLNYLNINGVIKESDRIAMYQKLQEPSLKNIFFHGKKPDIEKLINDSQFQIDASKIKEECWFNIKKIVYKKIKSIKNPVNQIGFIAHDSAIFDSFSSTILSMYNTIISPVLQSKSDFSELFSSYLYELRNLRYEFIKLLHNEYVKRAEDDIDIINALHNKEQLLIYIENFIKKVMNDIISQEKNIYQSIIFKNNLLNAESLTGAVMD